MPWKPPWKTDLPISMSGILDTNILLYAVNQDDARHEMALSFLVDATRSATWYLTDGIIYEFLRVSTHPRVFPTPLTASQAFSFLKPLLGNSRFIILATGTRHWQILSAMTSRLRSPTGNLFFDIRTVALMREHGIPRIYTADTDFLQFEGIEVHNPVQAC